MTSRDRFPAFVLVLSALLTTLPAAAITAVDDFVLGVEDRQLSMGHAELVANDDFDPKLPYTLVVEDQPAFGQLIVVEDKISYLPAAQFVGIDSFHYHLESPEGDSDPATVKIHVAPYYAPVVGDWLGDGSTLVGVFVNAPNPYFFLCLTLSENPQCKKFAAPAIFWGMLPIAGNWDGDPADEVGLYNPATGRFYLRDIGPNNTLPGIVSYRVGQGTNGNTPLAGDWDGDGVDSPSIRRAVDGFFALRNAHELQDGAFDHYFEVTGTSLGALAFFGDWDQNDVDGVGLYDPQTGIVSLRNSLTSGPPDFEAPLDIPGPLTPVWGARQGDASFVLLFFDRTRPAFYYVATWPNNAAIKVIVPTDPDG